MSNDYTSERLWTLDTVGVIVANQTWVTVRKLYYVPNAASDDIEIQEYGSDAVLRLALVLKAGTANASPVEQDFGPDGRRLNGFKLSTIDGGKLYVYLGKL